MNNLREIGVNNLKRIFFAHLNINFLRNKSELLFDQVKEMVDVLFIPETKLENSFSVVNLRMCPLFWLDRNQFGAGFVVFIREDISSKLLTSDLSVENLFIEINLPKNF